MLLLPYIILIPAFFFNVLPAMLTSSVSMAKPD
jgi:hypothetical protein